MRARASASGRTHLGHVVAVRAEHHEGVDGARAHVRLHGRDKGLAPGQYAAWYDGEECLGSGVIAEEGL